MSEITLRSFQFPSNGKLHSNNPNDSGKITGANRFNSLQTGNCIQTDGEFANVGRCLESFNSLQTGNCIQTKEIDLADTGGMPTEFQFPSNGKLHSNTCHDPYTLSAFLVSIPFKRETAFKLYYMSARERQLRNGFNSLQTGNCIQTRQRRHERGP